MDRLRCTLPICFALLTTMPRLTETAFAGPPYVSDDPEPTDFRHYEIYLFAGGTGTKDAASGQAGVDFNYGATSNLQLTAVFPLDFDLPRAGDSKSGLGNIELAAKYRFLHQADSGWDIAVFPRLFLPRASANVGDGHGSLLVPLWLQKDLEPWSMFGGGGCVLNRGGDSKDFCLAGWVLTRQVGPKVQLGAEIVHQTADSRGARASTGVGAGLTYGLNEHYHLLAYAGPGLLSLAARVRLFCALA
jgi:hypothetical protein